MNTILGVFDLEVENKVIQYLLQEYMLYYMMKQNTCSKGNKSSCVDLLIKN